MILPFYSLSDSNHIQIHDHRAETRQRMDFHVCYHYHRSEMIAAPEIPMTSVALAQEAGAMGHD